MVDRIRQSSRQRRRTGGWRRRVWDLSYIVLGVAIATASAWVVYENPRVIIAAAVGLVIGVGSVLLVRWRRWPGWFAPVIALVAYLVAVVPVAIPSAASTPLEVLRGVRDGLTGIVLGWKQLLTLSLPLGEYQAVLVPFLVVILAGTLIAATLALVDRFFSAAAAVAVIGMTLFGIVFGSSATGDPLVIGGLQVPAPREVLLGVLLLVVSVIWLIGRTRLQRTSALQAARASTVANGAITQGSQSVGLTLRRQLAGVVIVALALGAGVAIAPVANALGPRQALRDRVDPLLVLSRQPSPLSAYRIWFEADRYGTDLFTVSGAEGIDRLRLATLGEYDGQEFRVAAGDGSGAGDSEGVRFVRLPGGASAGGPTVEVTIDEGFTGIWLPMPQGVSSAPDFSGPRAAALSDGFYLDAASDSAIDTAAITGGGTASGGASGVGLNGAQPGDRYRVVAAPPAAVSDSAASDIFASATGGESLIPAAEYPELAAWVQAQEQPRSGAGLTELIERLRERGYLSHALTETDASADWVAALQERADYAFLNSYSGHSVARIETLFMQLDDQQTRAGVNATDADLVAGVGDDEQFAVASALLARFFGFDSRVVMGVRLAGDGDAGGGGGGGDAAADPASDPDPDLGVEPCETTCTGANMTAWIEVRSPNGGWVPFDVTPQFTVKPVVITEGEQLPENPTVPDEQQSELVDPSQAQRDDTEDTDSAPPVDTGWIGTVLLILGRVGLGLLAALLLVLPVVVLIVAKVVRRRGRRASPVPEAGLVGAWSELVDSYLDHGIEVPDGVTRSAVASAVGRPAATALAQAVDAAVFAEHPPGQVTRDEAWALVDAERRALGSEATLRGRLRALVRPTSFLRGLGTDGLVPRGLKPGELRSVSLTPFTRLRRKDAH